MGFKVPYLHGPSLKGAKSAVRSPAESTSSELCKTTMEWLADARSNGSSIRVIVSETGNGKTYVVQDLFDQLARHTEMMSTRFGGNSFWIPGLAPSWPPSSVLEVEQDRKSVVPPDRLRRPSPGNRLGFVWLALPLGEVGGATRLDMTGQLLDQLSNTHRWVVSMNGPSVTTRHRTAAARRSIFKFIKYVLDQFLPAVVSDAATGFKDGQSIIKDWRQATDNPEDALHEKSRDAVKSLIREISEIVGEKDLPFVVVLDDAHAAKTEVLEIVDLILESTQPVLVLATTWPNESELRTGGIFDEWIRQKEQTKSRRSKPVVHALGPMPKKEAIDLLLRSGMEERFVKYMAERLARPRKGANVVPLVLTHGRAFIDREVKGGFLVPELTFELLETLPDSPQFHTRERLDRLRETSEIGEQSYSLLAQLALWGAEVPNEVVTQLVVNLPNLESRSILELLNRQRMIDFPRTTDDFDVFRIQTDIQAFLMAETPFREPVKIASIASGEKLVERVRNECIEDESTRLPISEVNSFARAIRNLVPLGEMDVELDAMIEVMRLTRKVGTLGKFAYQLENVDLSSLESAARSGRSRWSQMAALAYANRVKREGRGADSSKDMKSRAVDLLRLHSNDNADVALVLASRLSRSEALGVLSPHAVDKRVAEKIRRLRKN